MYDNILKPIFNPVTAGHIGSISSALRIAQKEVSDKSKELILELLGNFDRIDKAVSFMCEHASVKSTEDYSGGWDYRAEGTVLTKEFSVKYFDFSWSDSDGSGRDPRRIVFKKNKDSIEYKIIPNTDGLGARTSILRNNEYLLDPSEKIDGSMDLGRLNEICSNVKWFASLCEMVVSLLKDKKSKRK